LSQFKIHLGLGRARIFARKQQHFHPFNVASHENLHKFQNLGVVDIAGSGPVHLIGGASAFASAAMLGPRLGRFVQL
jgi:ammonia channel protein AmtB